MASAFSVLGQLNPAATTLTTLYTCPANTQAVCSTLVVCNQGGAGTFRIAVRAAGAAINAKHYLAYDTAIAANAVATFTIGITLEATDIVSVYASSATMSFSLFGQEIT